MEGYLGEFPVDIVSHPKYKDYAPADWAMYFIEAYGQIDGGHHKQWVLDQVARILKGTPIEVVEARWENGQKEYRISTADEASEAYKTWALAMLGKYDKENEEYEYGYDIGCPP